MRENIKAIVIIFSVLILFLLVWAPWLNDKEIHDMFLKDRGRKDGTIVPIEKILQAKKH